MKFTWENGEWLQGEKPKTITFKEWLQTKGYVYIVIGLVLIGVWWWFVGEPWVFGDKFILPKHL